MNQFVGKNSPYLTIIADILVNVKTRDSLGASIVGYVLVEHIDAVF